MLKKLLFLAPIALFSYDNLLNNLKNREFDYEKNYSIENSKDLSKSWMSPVNFSYSINKTNLNPKRVSKNFSISVNQPIFKSGAIYYSIKYAKNLKNLNLINIELKKRELVKQALELAIDYKINLINKNIIKLNIKNTKIDIKKKKEAFLNGVGDSTLLNDAVLKLNSLKLNLVDIDLALFKLKKNFEKISNLDITKVNLPKLKLICKNDYVNKNLEISSERYNIKIQKDLYKMNVGNTLLSLNINGNYNIVKNSYKENLPTLDESTYNYYNIGISLNWPFNFNALNKIQKSKINYLKSRIELNDKKNELSKDYAVLLKEIKIIDQKIKIYKENIKIYDSLIASTKDAIKGGDATGLDLDIMENSQKTSLLNIKILNLQKQKILLELFYKLSISNFSVSFSNFQYYRSINLFLLI
ncbi:TolC family protein [Lebetimonas sp. JH292]|uniref:TolC family protein n=1 Tax=Lebetimonas sp. JH292 TaxID=990068 RepID=UPI0004638095|nr:TolC family protein [Lebetimonas sp. JH292]